MSKMIEEVLVPDKIQMATDMVMNAPKNVIIIRIGTPLTGRTSRCFPLTKNTVNFTSTLASTDIQKVTRKFLLSF